MSFQDLGVDAWIASAAEFARPLLSCSSALVHEARLGVERASRARMGFEAFPPS
jgi:hypothetical protein